MRKINAIIFPDLLIADIVFLSNFSNNSEEKYEFINEIYKNNINIKIHKHLTFDNYILIKFDTNSDILLFKLIFSQHFNQDYIKSHLEKHQNNYETMKEHMIKRFIYYNISQNS